MGDGGEWGQDRWVVVVESHRPDSTREIAPSLANDFDLDSESPLRNAIHLIDVETFDFLIEAVRLQTSRHQTPGYRERG